MEISRYDSNGRFCQAVVYNGLLFTSGLVDIEQDSFEAQTRGVFSKIESLLEAYGSGKDRIISASAYLTDASQAAEFNALWLEWIVPEHEPVRTTIVTKMVHPDVLFEMSVIAALNP